jgi:hypothetical protein
MRGFEELGGGAAEVEKRMSEEELARLALDAVAQEAAQTNYYSDHQSGKQQVVGFSD